MPGVLVSVDPPLKRTAGESLNSAPVALLTLGFGLGSPLTLSIALIWLAHIGIDRALGYGLKYSAGFGFTHLGRIGRQKDA